MSVYIKIFSATISAKKIIDFSITMLLVFLPLHSLFINFVIGAYLPGIKYWKEIFVLLIILLFVRDHRRYEIFFILFILYIFGILFASNITSGLYGIRNYLEPLFLFYVLSRINIEKNDLEKYIKIYITMAILISIWGIFQQSMLGPNFLLSLGFPNDTTYPNMLEASHYVAGGLIQRNLGTFSHANSFGVFLAIAIILLLEFKYLYSKKHMIFVMLLLSISLLLTFSRSSMLGLIIVLLLFYPNKIFLFILLLILSAVFLSFFDDIWVTLTALIMNSVSGNDPSMGGHYDSFSKAIEMLNQYWFSGIGIGSLGPKAALFTDKLINVESSFLALILDIGIFGLVLYVLNLRELIIFKFTFKISIILFISWFFLPTIYEIELILITFIIAGLYISFKKNLKRKYDESSFLCKA